MVDWINTDEPLVRASVRFGQLTANGSLPSVRTRHARFPGTRLGYRRIRLPSQPSAVFQPRGSACPVSDQYAQWRPVGTATSIVPKRRAECLVWGVRTIWDITDRQHMARRQARLVLFGQGWLSLLAATCILMNGPGGYRELKRRPAAQEAGCDDIQAWCLEPKLAILTDGNYPLAVELSKPAQKLAPKARRC